MEKISSDPASSQYGMLVDVHIIDLEKNLAVQAEIPQPVKFFPHFFRNFRCTDIDFNYTQNIPVHAEYFLIDRKGEVAGLVKENRDHNSEWIPQVIDMIDVEEGAEFINFKSQRFFKKTLADIESSLDGISYSMAEKIISDKRGRIAEQKQKREEQEAKIRLEEERNKQQQLEREAAKSLASQRWKNRLNIKLDVGDTVCAYNSNHFGQVEAFNDRGDRVKVYVVGKAVHPEYGTRALPEGYFFSGNAGRFKYDKVEAYRWFRREQISLCGADIP